MSSRNRGRGQQNQDADEERRLWKEIQDRAKDVDAMINRSNEIGHEIIQVEDEQTQHVTANGISSASLDERLEKLYRENVKLCEDVNHILEGKSNEMNLLDSINVLTGLREASEESAALLPVAQPPSSRNASGKLSRATKKGSSTKVSTAATATAAADDTDDAPAAPSPKIVLGPSSRLGKDKPSRAGSVSATREPSVKLEGTDGAESVASSADGIPPSSTATGPVSASKAGSLASRPTNRLVLTKGEIVFCRHSSTHPHTADTQEGEGILCRVTAVIGEGKQRRYEVQDADPSGEPPPPQRASVAQLIQIPEKNQGLPELGKGKNVLAQYPDTTTFYKAEVVEAWRGSGSGDVKLKFEDDDLSAREVERRFVLTEK